MKESQVLVPYEPPKKENNFFSLANLVMGILTVVIAAATTFTTIQINATKTESRIEQLETTNNERKVNRDKEISDIKAETKSDIEDLKKQSVNKEVFEKQNEILNNIYRDTQYLRDRVDRLEETKKDK